MTEMVKILGQIRDELKTTRTELASRLDQTNERLDQTNERLDQTNERLSHLERRQVETEVRLATELVSVTTAIGELKKVLVEDRKLRAQVSDHERRLGALERKRALERAFRGAPRARTSGDEGAHTSLRDASGLPRALGAASGPLSPGPMDEGRSPQAAEGPHRTLPVSASPGRTMHGGPSGGYSP